MEWGPAGPLLKNTYFGRMARGAPYEKNTYLGGWKGGAQGPLLKKTFKKTPIKKTFFGRVRRGVAFRIPTKKQLF